MAGREKERGRDRQRSTVRRGEKREQQKESGREIKVVRVRETQNYMGKGRGGG